MARTSKSRGIAPFTMRSSNTPSHDKLSGASPYPFLKGLGKAILGGPLAGIKSIIDKRKEKQANEGNAAGIGGAIGGAATGGEGDKIQAIRAILDSDDENAIGGGIV
jgi:hypothetical protein